MRVSTLVTVSGVQSRPLWGEAPFRLRGPGTRVMSVVGMVSVCGSVCGYRTGGGRSLAPESLKKKLVAIVYPFFPSQKKEYKRPISDRELNRLRYLQA